MDDLEKSEFARELASNLHEAAKQNQRPWWLSWGIPMTALGVFSWLGSEVYTGLKEGQTQATQTNQVQNESLAVTAQVLKEIQSNMTEVKEEIRTVRSDPYTGADAKDLRHEFYQRFSKNETRIMQLEQRQQTVLIEAERTKATLNAIAD